MKFIREIPIEKVTAEVLKLESLGFVFKWTSDSVEVWAADTVDTVQPLEMAA